MHFDNLIIAEMFDFSKNSIDHFLLEIFAIFFLPNPVYEPEFMSFSSGFHTF